MCVCVCVCARARARAELIFNLSEMLTVAASQCRRICFRTISQPSDWPNNQLATLTPWSRACLEKPVITQVVEELHRFYGLWSFIAVVTRASLLSRSWPIRIQFVPLNVMKIHFNIIFPYISRSSKWSNLLCAHLRNELFLRSSRFNRVVKLYVISRLDMVILVAMESTRMSTGAFIACVSWERCDKDVACWCKWDTSLGTRHSGR